LRPDPRAAAGIRRAVAAVLGAGVAGLARIVESARQ